MAWHGIVHLPPIIALYLNIHAFVAHMMGGVLPQTRMVFNDNAAYTISLDSFGRSGKCYDEQGQFVTLK